MAAVDCVGRGAAAEGFDSAMNTPGSPYLRHQSASATSVRHRTLVCLCQTQAPTRECNFRTLMSDEEQLPEDVGSGEIGVLASHSDCRKGGSDRRVERQVEDVSPGLSGWLARATYRRNCARGRENRVTQRYPGPVGG